MTRAALARIRQLAGAEPGPRTYRWTLLVVMLWGLALRLHAAWLNNLGRPNGPARFLGDERSYNDLALGLLRWHTFDWEGRVPLYPAWLAFVHAVTPSPAGGPRTSTRERERLPPGDSVRGGPGL